MQKRRPLAPNNRQGRLLSEFLVSEAAAMQYPKSNEKSSIVTYAGPGRPMDGGVGGGNRVGRKR